MRRSTPRLRIQRLMRSIFEVHGDDARCPLLKGVVLLFLVTGCVAGCRSVDSVTPGRGRTVEIRGHTYDEIWRAAIRVADEHADILERDEARGVIRAERTYHFMGDNGWIGIFITP